MSVFSKASEDSILYADVQVQGKGKRVIMRVKKSSKLQIKQTKRRLPKGLFLKLRHGGSHTTKKGKKGYNRKREKGSIFIGESDYE
jgi:hypothetical protein